LKTRLAKLYKDIYIGYITLKPRLAKLY